MADKNSKLTLLIAGIFLFFLVITAALGYFIYQNYQLQQKMLPPNQNTATDTQPEITTTPTDVSSPTATTTAATATPNPHPDWETYTSQDHGFKFSYPPEFEALDSVDDLYGWPDGVALLYKGGQAYDIPIEIWDNQSDYQTKYQNRLSELEVKQINGKYVTFLNNTDNQFFQEIVNTFEQI